MDVVLDYRPALRARTGLGEYVHELAAALARSAPAGDRITVFTSSWKDRPSPQACESLAPARVVDQRWPVRLLDAAWQHTGWPPIEWLAGPCDIAHSPTPLRLPARRAAQVVTLFDLFFLDAPEAAAHVTPSAFGRVARTHLQQADHVVAGSAYAARLATERLNLDPSRVTVTRPGVPAWTAGVRAARKAGEGDCLLFLGTLEPRKNIEGLLAAYGRLVAQQSDAPPLVLAGRVTPAIAPLLATARASGLGSRIETPGYVSQATREALLRRARVLVLPSWDEGFGLPVLEAMACGVPVVASDRGALPEVLGDAGRLVPPDDHGALSAAIASQLDRHAAADAAARGLARAAQFTWAATADATRTAYAAALRARAARR